MQKYKQKFFKNTQFLGSLSFSISGNITGSSSDNEVIKVLLQDPLTLPASVSLSLLFSVIGLSCANTPSISMR